MATIEQLESALRKAHEAGNTEHAKRFAAEIRRMRSETQAQPAPGSEPLNYKDIMRRSLTNIAKSAPGGPIGMMTAAGVEGLNNMGKLMERGGYQTGNAVAEALQGHVPAEVAGAVGYGANVATQAIPTLMGGMAGEKIIKPAMEAGGRRLMQSALKPKAADILSGDSTKAINTLLERGANVTPGGQVKLTRIKENLIDQIEKTLDAVPAGTTVSKRGPAAEIRELLKKSRKQVNPSDDIKEILKAWDDFHVSNPNAIPVRTANDIKKGTYEALGGKNYGEIKGASIEAQKALARGLKKEIENVAPNIGAQNAELGEILNALRQTDYRVPMAANRDVAGISTIAAHPGYMMASLADRSPYIKSIMAQLMYHGAKPAGVGIGAGTGALLSND